jgi:hypothetical protein
MRYAANHVRWLVSFAALALACGGGRAEAGTVLTPVDARGIRQFPGAQPILLNFLAINRSIEDRTVLQFDLGGLSVPAGPSTLDLSLQNIDPGGPMGVIDVYTFVGTGTVTPDQFGAGTLLTSFSNNQSGLVHVDVTAAVQYAADGGQRSLGFRLSTESTDRYFLGPPFTAAGPTLTIVPEPSGLVLLGTAAAVGLAYAMRHRGRRMFT